LIDSLSERLRETGAALGESIPAAGTVSRSRRVGSLSPPTAEGMERALESGIDKALGDADGAFLAGLLDAGEADDPARKDYGDRYRYIDALGEGGQGRVLRFRDAVLDRDVAIKVVKPPYTRDRERQLENEARLGGMLEHPNILPTYDLCRDETGSPFFVMKKVEGVTLDDLLKRAHAEGGAIRSDRDRGEFSRRRLLNVFLQVCHAMEYAHSRGVCHLDLKPQNVKLGPFGEVYVLDWGFAAREDDLPKVVAGTPLYIAPERFKPGKPDARCDIYSLGVMLYRILVNQLPRDVGKVSFKEFRRCIRDFPIIAPRGRDPSLPRDLEAIVMKAIRDNPDQRYRSVQELADDLERYLDILPITAYREGWSGRALKFYRRHQATVIAATVMLAAVLLTGGAFLRARHAAAQAEEAELRVREESGRRERTNLRLAMAEEERKEAVRRRAAARVPLEKGVEILDKSKAAVDKERDNVRKLQLLQPAIDLFTRAAAILEDGRKDSPDAAEAYYARARAYEQAREIGMAARDYRQAYLRDESYIMARYYLGRIHFDVDRNPERAIAEFRAMNDIDPGNEFSELGRAYIEAHTGKDGSALERVARIEAADRAARGEAAGGESWRNPGLYEIWLIRGLVHGRRGGEFYDPEKAIAAYGHYIAYQPDKPSAYLNRGILHQELFGRLRADDPEAAREQLDLALADYSRALQANPEFKWALQHRGYALFKHRDDIEAGLRDIERALAIDPRYVAALFDRAAIREAQKRYRDAAADYELIRRVQPENRNLDYRLAMLHLYQDDLAGAERNLDRAVPMAASAADRGVRVHRRGVVRFLLGRYREAEQDFSRSLELRSDGKAYPALMRWLALMRLGETPDPAEFARQMQIGPDKPWLALVASIYLGEDPYGEDQAIRLAATPEALCETAFYLGARAWVRGETVNALAFFRRALASELHVFMEYNMARILARRVAAGEEDAKRLPDRVAPDPPPTVPLLSDLVDTLP
jgi:tetratricopeptide (TPR) repeat protein